MCPGLAWSVSAPGPWYEPDNLHLCARLAALCWGSSLDGACTTWQILWASSEHSQFGGWNNCWGDDGQNEAKRQWELIFSLPDIKAHALLQVCHQYLIALNSNRTFTADHILAPRSPWAGAKPLHAQSSAALQRMRTAPGQWVMLIHSITACCPPTPGSQPHWVKPRPGGNPLLRDRSWGQIPPTAPGDTKGHTTLGSPKTAARYSGKGAVGSDALEMTQAPSCRSTWYAPRAGSPHQLQAHTTLQLRAPSTDGAPSPRVHLATGSINGMI